MPNSKFRRIALWLTPLIVSLPALCIDQSPVLLPLSKSRLLQALEYRVLTADQLLERIASRGVDFELTDTDWQEFTRKGASSRLISALRSNYRPNGAATVKAANANLAEAQIFAGPPLLKREVELMLQMKVPIDKITKAVGARGVDFGLTPEVIHQTFELGGSLVFIGELMLNTRSNDPLPSPETLFAAVRGESAAIPKPTPAPTPAPAVAAAKSEAVPMLQPPPSKPKPVMVASSVPVAPSPEPSPVSAAVVPEPVKPTNAPAPQSASVTPRLVVENGLQATKLIKQVAPIYPSEARGREVTGTVRLEVLIATDGQVMNVRQLAGPPALGNAAVKAVKQWLYRPTIINGTATEVVTIVDVRFHL